MCLSPRPLIAAVCRKMHSAGGATEREARTIAGGEAATVSVAALAGKLQPAALALPWLAGHAPDQVAWAHGRTRRVMYRSKLVAKSIAFTALALPAVAQSTYIVDDNGPADFTDFPAAIAAAIPGDVLVVRAGAYSSISLSEGLTILCDDGVSAPALEVSNIPSDEIAVVSGLSAPRVALAHCTGTVILQHLMSLPPNSTSGTSSPVFDVLSCDDVRVYRSTITAPYDSNGSSSTPGPAAVHISSSRVELVRCAIIGGRMGYTVDDCAPVVGAGGDGVSIDDHSFVHVALSSVQGGDGSDVVNLFCTYSQPGNGGHAVEVSGQSTVVIAGTRTDVIRGGDRGKSTQSFNPNLSEPGRALFVHGGCSARYSGATLLLGHGSASLPWTVTTISAPIGAANQAIPADPTLER